MLFKTSFNSNSILAFELEPNLKSKSPIKESARLPSKKELNSINSSLIGAFLAKPLTIHS